MVCDVTKPTEVADALGPHLEDIGVVVHNAHSLLIKPATDTTAVEFEDVWRTACLGAFIACRTVLPRMVAVRAGTIILTGATAGIRGGANFAAFASAKFALRGLAQALAREFGPKGIHVAHVVLDGLIEEAQTEKRFGPSSAMRMDPDAVARTYLDSGDPASFRMDARVGYPPIHGTLLKGTKMIDELINADFSQRVVILTDELPWISSPQSGVERRPLDPMSRRW